jgi:hypothetical protein
VSPTGTAAPRPRSRVWQNAFRKSCAALFLSPAFFDAASASAQGARRLTTDTRARRRGVA